MYEVIQPRMSLSLQKESEDSVPRESKEAEELEEAEEAGGTACHRESTLDPENSNQSMQN